MTVCEYVRSPYLLSLLLRVSPHRRNRLSDSEWTTLINLNTLLNRCHLMGGSGAVESKSNITSRLRQYNQTVDELNRVAEASNVLDLEVQAFARCARNRMVRDKASYLCEAVLNADALSPRTVPSPDVRHRLAKTRSVPRVATFRSRPAGSPRWIQMDSI
eukprot:GHVU01230516.1.p1 GENE.GHVU01230516.1~~GHVU01230516.1.p1  ORF type:complete len:160 (+),score=7.21 GHVU01230516.1:151-630(+)